jgi:hypothetical protein
MQSRRSSFAPAGKLVAAAVLSISFCAAHAQSAKEQAVTAAITDGFSTAAGLAAAGVELNPLVPLLAVGMKTATFQYASGLPDTEQPAVYAAAAAMWSGATAGNLCFTAALLTGGGLAPACLVLGMAWGAKTWKDTEHERRFWADCALLREYTQQPALACVYQPEDAPVAQSVPIVVAQDLTAP